MSRIYAILIILLACLNLEAQQFQGKAIYQFFNNYGDVDWGKKDMSDADIAMWKSKLSQESRTSFELLFNLNESSWAEMDALSMDGKGEKYGEWGEPLDKLLYKNISTQSYLLEAELFDKGFLVNDQLELPSWQLTEDTKSIGLYSAQKAIWEFEEEVVIFGTKEKETQISQITAWFTTEVPVSHGPDIYWGLPGLILEVENGAITYICEKVILNPDEVIEIKIPKNGQKVNKAELDKIAEEKKQEILKRYNKTGGKG